MERSPREGFPAPGGFGAKATRPSLADAPPVPFSVPERLGEIDSTNRYLADLVAQRRSAGDPLPTGYAVAAEVQTAGRGRLGRRWEAPRGSSVLCSILWRTELEARDRHLLTWVVALAAADASEEVAGVEAKVKWPNDVLVRDRKVAGLLAEVVGGPDGAGVLDVVVGVGINVNWPADWPPEGGDDPELVALAARATSLSRACGHEVDVGEVEGRLLACAGASASRLATASGRRGLAAAFERRCVTIGRLVRVEQADGSFTGTASGLDEAGSLVVETDDATVAVAAGDVVHLR